MPPSDERLRLYQARLSRWVRQFAHGSTELRPGELEPGSSVDEVRTFVAENLVKRRDKVAAYCGLLAETSPDLPRRIDAYIRSVGAAACGTARGDALRFLDWLESRGPLDGESRDALAIERSRLIVEDRARRRRIEYVRFAELRSVVTQQVERLASDPARRLILNPTCVRADLTTHRFLDGDTPLPARAVFLAVDEDLRTCVLEGEGLAVVEALERAPRCTFGRLCETLFDVPAENLIEQCRALAGCGLLAVE